MTNMKMRKQSKKRGELSWPRMMMQKWLNIKSTGDEFSADEFSANERDEDTEPDTESESECEYEDTIPAAPRSYTTRNFSPLMCRKDGRDDEVLRRRSDTTIRRGQSETLNRQYINTEELQIAVGTWNVAGRTPPPHLDLKNWLEMDDPADIYVLGFQEIVPLNAGNVFGAEETGPTIEWQALIRQRPPRQRGGWRVSRWILRHRLDDFDFYTHFLTIWSRLAASLEAHSFSVTTHSHPSKLSLLSSSSTTPYIFSYSVVRSFVSFFVRC